MHVYVGLLVVFLFNQTALDCLQKCWSCGQSENIDVMRPTKLQLERGLGGCRGEPLLVISSLKPLQTLRK